MFTPTKAVTPMIMVIRSVERFSKVHISSGKVQTEHTKSLASSYKVYIDEERVPREFERHCLVSLGKTRGSTWIWNQLLRKTEKGCTSPSEIA